MTFFRSLFIIITLCLSACATYKPQYKNNSKVDKFPDTEIAYSFYLIGDGGDSPKNVSSEAINAFKLDLNKASQNSSAIFLGSNIYPDG